VWASVPRIIFIGPTAPPNYSSVGFGPSNRLHQASSAFILFECGLQSLESSSSGQRHFCIIRVRASVPQIILFGPAAPLCYSTAGFGPSNYSLRASSASTLFECGFLIPRFVSFGHQCFHSIRIRTAVLRISVLCYQCFQIARNMVAIRQFGCHMSNTKVSPQLATLDDPVFVSSVLCRENFNAYSVKKCTD
jgi:hypothetical protein